MIEQKGIKSLIEEKFSSGTKWWGKISLLLPCRASSYRPAAARILEVLHL